MKNNLFNLNSIKKYTNNFVLTQQKRDKVERYIERVQNKEFKGETKGYLAFLKFLEDILDYEEDKHISFDDNVDIGSDRVEFALKDNDGKFMVIELKGQNADLDKPQNRANDKRTPVEQAFGYAQHSSKKSGLVQWILVSNYKEFRLYSYEKRLGEYISFNVEDLLNDDIFKTFMFAFSKESHIDLKAINDLVNENYIEKTQLANNFYKLFNETRLMIYKELHELHGMDKEDAISYAQTIVDRFIFICFASSRELLPDDIARKTLLDRIKSENLREYNVWRELNYLFNDVNTGKEDRDISGYNGGLFKKDFKDVKLKDIIKNKEFFKDVYQKWNFKEFEERLEKEIKPSILKRINPIYINLLIISYFEFSEETKEDDKHKLDIEILGHIFENSIGDIEEIKEDSKGRRKKDGIFYTPDHITDYICKNTIIPYLSISGNVNTIEGLLGEYSTGREIEKLDQKLKKIRIVDPACGSGAFLNKSTDILLDIHNSIFNIKKEYTTSQPMRVGKGARRKTENVQHIDLGAYVFDALSKRREILLDNIYGVDLNSESVEITKLSLFLKVCEKDKILPAIDKNILCGNSLIDDPEFTNKPFNWKKEFKEIFNEGGFDVVIGNPPYVRMEKIKGIKPYLKEHYDVYTGKSDLYVYFFEKGINLLKEGGMFAFICSNIFTRAEYGKKLRELILRNNFLRYNDYTEIKVFEDANVDPCIIVLKKGTPPIESEIRIDGKFSILQNELNGDNWSFKNPDILNLKDKIYKNSLKIKEIEDIKFYRGITTGYNKAFIINADTKEKLISEDPKNKDIIKPLIRGRDVKRYRIDYKDFYVILSKNKMKVDTKYPSILDYFIPFEKQLKNRYDKGESWFNLRDCTYYDKFEENKLIYPRINTKFFATPDIDNFYLLDSVFMMSSSRMNIFYLGVILSSNVSNFIFKLIAPPLARTSSNPLEKPRYIHGKVYVEQLPIYPATYDQQKPFIEKGKKMLELNKEFMNEINSFKEWLQLNFDIKKFSQKLDKYYKLDLKELLVELKRKKVKLNSNDIKEIKEEFSSNKDRVIRLNTEIEKTDDEINQMVYDLYGLTNEEIKIIEDGL